MYRIDFLLALCALLIVAVVVALPAAFERQTRISSDANILFYNGPAAVSLGDCGPVAVGYLTSRGLVRAQIRDRKRILHDTVVHDFATSINPVHGATADDHAPPALYFDKPSKTLYLATAYHGTDLFIYKSSVERPSWLLHRRIVGNFTYPRFVGDGMSLLLFVREIVRDAKGRPFGHLATLDPHSGTKTTIAKAPDRGHHEEVIYASTPHVHGGKVYFAYTLFDGTRNKGAFLGVFDLKAKTWTDRKLLKDEIVPSPVTTGVWADGKRVRVGLSQTSAEDGEDIIRIVEMSLNGLYEREIYRTKRPVLYYQNTVAFHPSGTWLISNPSFLHPQYVEGGRGSYLSVSSNIERYSIRDFNTSLILTSPMFSNWCSR